MGLIGTMTALVLGLLIASAKNSFDAQRNGLAQLSANIILLDRALARYGPESKDARDAPRLGRRHASSTPGPRESSVWTGRRRRCGPKAGMRGSMRKSRDSRRRTIHSARLQAQALKTGADIAQMRWLMFAQKGSSIPTPFLVVMVCWLALILASFSLFAPSNATVFITLLVCALAVSSAVFLILELDRPFDGMIQISSAAAARRPCAARAVGNLPQTLDESARRANPRKQPWRRMTIGSGELVERGRPTGARFPGRRVAVFHN